MVEHEQSERGWLVLGGEAEHGVEAATLVLGVAGYGGKPEPGQDNEAARGANGNGSISIIQLQ